MLLPSRPLPSLTSLPLGESREGFPLPAYSTHDFLWGSSGQSPAGQGPSRGPASG